MKSKTFAKIMIALPRDERGEHGQQLARELSYRISIAESKRVTIGECIIRGLEMLDAETRKGKKR